VCSGAIGVEPVAALVQAGEGAEVEEFCHADAIIAFLGMDVRLRELGLSSTASLPCGPGLQVGPVVRGPAAQRY